MTQVRPAGEDAWLGGAAPEDPDLDGVGDGGDLVTDAGFSLTGGAAVSGSEEKAGASGAGALSTGASSVVMAAAEGLVLSCEHCSLLWGPAMTCRAQHAVDAVASAPARRLNVDDFQERLLLCSHFQCQTTSLMPHGATAVRQRTSFRSVKQAVAAARDGDQILLLAGIHNGMGCALPSRVL